jgi:hypothetical protein
MNWYLTAIFGFLSWFISTKFWSPADQFDPECYILGIRGIFPKTSDNIYEHWYPLGVSFLAGVATLLGLSWSFFQCFTLLLSTIVLVGELRWIVSRLWIFSIVIVFPFFSVTPLATTVVGSDWSGIVFSNLFLAGLLKLRRFGKASQQVYLIFGIAFALLVFTRTENSYLFVALGALTFHLLKNKLASIKLSVFILAVIIASLIIQVSLLASTTKFVGVSYPRSIQSFKLTELVNEHTHPTSKPSFVSIKREVIQEPKLRELMNKIVELNGGDRKIRRDLVTFRSVEASFHLWGPNSQTVEKNISFLTKDESTINAAVKLLFQHNTLNLKIALKDVVGSILSMPRIFVSNFRPIDSNSAWDCDDAMANISVFDAIRSYTTCPHTILLDSRSLFQIINKFLGYLALILFSLCAVSFLRRTISRKNSFGSIESLLLVLIVFRTFSYALFFEMFKLNGERYLTFNVPLIIGFVALQARRSYVAWKTRT